QRLRLHDQDSRRAGPSLWECYGSVAGEKRRRPVHRIPAAAEGQLIEMRVIVAEPAAQRGKEPRSEERRGGKEREPRRATYQAEDGIRDFHVTGVQTCALPISEVATARSGLAQSRPIPLGMLWIGRR